MKFLTQDDFTAVCDPSTLQVIAQAESANLNKAEAYAIEEISCYLRSRYNVANDYDKTANERNPQLVMITVDVALYHLVSWLPKKIGFEMRELRYDNAIAWCKDVQSGKATPLLSALVDEQGNDVGCPIQFRSIIGKSKYDY